MLRKMIGTAVLAVAIAMGTAWAGDTATKQAATDKQAAAADKMQAMKAGMMKCSVCRVMVPHMDELGPMKMEVSRLNDGIAIMHTTANTEKAATYHKVAKEIHAAGDACMAMTDEQAKSGLCEHCQEVRSVVKAGAKVSAGETKLGDIFILTSNDPVVQAKISALGDKCAMMAESM